MPFFLDWHIYNSSYPPSYSSHFTQLWWELETVCLRWDVIYLDDFTHFLSHFILSPDYGLCHLSIQAVCLTAAPGLIGAASVICMGQQEPVKEIRYIAFWSLYQVVAINSAKAQDTSVHWRQTESEHEEKAEVSSGNTSGWFLKSLGVSFQLSLLLFLSPPIMSSLMWYFTTIKH